MSVKIRDLAGEVREWATSGIETAVRSGDPGLGGAVLLGDREVFGVAVTWVIAAAQGPGGQPVQLPVWFLTVTHPSPLPGTPPLTACQPIGSPEPDEPQVRAMTRKAVQDLRGLWAAQLKAGTEPAAGSKESRMRHTS